MSKTPITWIGLINEKISERKAQNKPAGVRDVVGEAKSEWATIKSGKHSKYIQGKSTGPKSSKNKTKKTKKSKKSKKGSPSITRPGHVDYRTHKGDKSYHRDGHLETENVEGVKGKPYSHRKTQKVSAKSVLKSCDLCKKCSQEIKKFLKQHK